jgi:hypothetical protein
VWNPWLPRPNDLSLDPVAFRLGLTVVVLIQAFSALGYHQRGQVNFSSDQAVPALMALEIRDHGSHPVFYWGVQYDGSLEPHLLSLAFRVLPETVESYRLVMFALMAFATVLVSLATALGFGRRAGLLAGAYLAAGPSFVFYKLLASDGVYASFFTLTAASVYLVTSLVRQTEERRTTLLVLALGTVLGIAWWVNPLSVVLAGVVAAGFLVSHRTWLKPIRVGLLCTGFVLGASPWLLENFRTGFASLRSSEMAGADPQQVLSQAHELFARGLPVLLGGRSPGGKQETFPGSEAMSVVLFGGLVIAGACLARREPSRPARFLALSSTILLVAPSVLALSRARTNLREDPRFLLSSYVAIAVLSGVGLAMLIERGARLRALALAGLLVLLGPLSQLRSPRYGGDPRHGRIRETIALADRLAASGIQDVYAEYWIAYRLTFLSRGQVVASPFGEGAPGPVRDLRAHERVDGAASPAFILEPDPARRLVAFLDARSAAYSHERFPDLGRELIWGIPSAEMKMLRACRCYPAPGPASPGAGSGTPP